MTLDDVLVAHKLWLNGDPKGKRADWRGADLRYADLRGDDLRGADLYRADLCGADLRRVDLRRADLRRADLCGADLRGAILAGARVTDTQTYEEYHEHLPELLMAGGRSVAEVVKAWDCHSWDNCPMAVAFGVHDIGDVPKAWQARAGEFVKLFDSGLVKKPTTRRQRKEKSQ